VARFPRTESGPKGGGGESESQRLGGEPQCCCAIVFAVGAPRLRGPIGSGALAHRHIIRRRDRAL